MQGILPFNEYLYSKIYQGKKIIEIYYGLQLLKILSLEDKPLIYLEAVTYISSGMRKSEIARAFGFDYSWVYKLTKIYEREGCEGILNLKRGPNTKVTEEIERFIVKRFEYYYELQGGKNFRDNIIEDVVDEYDFHISYETLRMTIKPYKERVKQGETKSREHVEQNSHEENKDKLPEKQEKSYNRYSGLLLLNTFIKEIPIFQNFKNITNKNNIITNIVTLLIYMLFLTKTKIENYKELNHRELSMIIGTEYFTYPEDVRRVLREHLNLNELMETNKLMFKYYVEKEENKDRWIFIDGHVLRYYGRHKIPKGYHQQSNSAVPGRAHYFMHTSDGRPIYFEINDFYNDFREMINKLIGEMKKIAGEKGYRKYLFVFDRGGYSFDEFRYLKDEEKINFATWAKNDRTDYKKLDLGYEEIEIELKGNHIDKPVKKKFYVAVINDNYKIKNPNRKEEFVELRKIVIRNGKKHTSFLTNDYSRSPGELAKALYFRWREEKSFEVEVKYRGLNDINSYRVEDFSDDVIKKLGYEDSGTKYIESDEYKRYTKKRRELKLEIKKQQQKLGKLVEEKKSLEKIKDNKKYKNAIAEIQKLKKSLAAINERIKTSNEKIKKIDALISNRIKRLDYTQKFFIDIIRVVCSHLDSDIMKALSRFYKNGRDIYKMIDIILATGGYIEKNDSGNYVVMLNRLNTKKENNVLKSFIEYVNSQNPTFLLDESKQVLFDLQSH